MTYTRLPEAGWSQRNPGIPPEIARVPLHERIQRAVTKAFDQFRAEGEPPKEMTKDERRAQAEDLRKQADALERQ